MADGGWIAVQRKVQTSFVWANPFVLKLWMLCLFKANFTTNRILFNGQEIQVDRGQFITGRVALASEYNKGARREHQLSPTSINRWLNKFRDLQMVDISSNAKYSVVTVLNYDAYQPGGQLADMYPTSSGHQADTVKNSNNSKKESSSHKSANRTYDEQSKELRAATKLWELIQRNNPKAKQQDLQKWADVFRLMHERDNRSWKDIGTLIQWSQNDSFWSANILSANKLRKQFDQLTAKMNQEGGGFVPEQPPLETPHTFSAAEYAVSAYQTGSSVDEIIAMAKDEGAPATPDEIRAAIDEYNKRREEDE